MKKPSSSHGWFFFFTILLSILFIWIFRSSSKLKISIFQSNSTSKTSVIESTSKSQISVNKSDCSQSHIESDGFICESTDVWNERKRIFDSQEKDNIKLYPTPQFFASNWEPNFHCTHTRRIGSRGDGGKWVCDPHRLKLRNDCLVYSVGSNGDFSFEIELKKFLPHCEIHSFDKNVFQCPQNVCIFHQVMFGDGIQPTNSKNWLTILQELNHTNRIIDILKIDIEGGEYTFFPLVFNSKNNTVPHQILVELHPTNITIIHDFFNRLRDNFYIIFNKENNILAGAFYFEYGFLKLNPLFFTKSHNKNTNLSK